MGGRQFLTGDPTPETARSTDPDVDRPDRLLLFIRTEQGRIGWFVLVPGQVIIDGERTSGYLHLERNRRLLLLSCADELRL